MAVNMYYIYFPKSSNLTFKNYPTEIRRQEYKDIHIYVIQGSLTAGLWQEKNWK